MPMFKKQLAALLFVAAAAICTVLYTSHTDSSAELQPASDNISPAQGAASANDKIVVYVTGAVNNPGVIELPADSRIIDAVNKCGGMNESADPENINMAQKVTDGSQIKIPDKSNSDTSDIPGKTFRPVFRTEIEQAKHHYGQDRDNQKRTLHKLDLLLRSHLHVFLKANLFALIQSDQFVLLFH